jgi:hypothetical protein
MAENLKNTGSRPKAQTSKSWTLLLVGELGNIASFRLSKTSLVCLATAFVVACTFSVFATVTHFSLQVKNKSLQDKLNDVTTQLLAANKANETSQVRLMLLEGKATSEGADKRQNKAQQGQQAKPQKTARPDKRLVAKKSPLAPKAKPKKAEPKKLASAAQKDQPAVEKQPRSAFVTAEAARPPAYPQKAAQTEAQAIPSKADETTETPVSSSDGTASGQASEADDPDTVAIVSEGKLLVEKLEIWEKAEERSLRFQFSLKNVGETGEKVKGYTFVVLKAEDGSHELSRGSPWTPLKDGLPTIYKRGQFFSIARFKYVRGTVPQIQDVGRFKTATIYVFTESGDLLIEKIFQVNEILRS